MTVLSERFALFADKVPSSRERRHTVAATGREAASSDCHSQNDQNKDYTYRLVTPFIIYIGITPYYI